MSPDAKPPKKSLFQRWTDRNKSEPISDEDLLKYTGKTREEFDKFKESTPGVAGNRVSGTLGMGPTSGIAGFGAQEGVGGWGPGAAPGGKNRGLKFPPGYKEEEAAKAKAKAIEEEN